MSVELGRFLAVSAIVIVTPGQDTALVIRNALAGGRRGALFTALGVAAGQATWTVAAVAGLTALLIASKPAFAALRLAGAAYLAWLGARSLHRAWSRDPPMLPAPDRGRPTGRLAPRTALAQGWISALGNPKLAVFFTSLLPQFMPRGPGPLPALLALGLTFCVMTLIWLSGYALVLGNAARLRAPPGIRRGLDAALGATLVALGIRLAWERP